MSFLPRTLRRLPLAWWLTTGTVAVIVGFLVSSAVAQSAAAAARYESPQSVLVVIRDIDAGAVLTPADVRVEEWPASFLSSSPAVTSVDDAIAVVPMSAGEPLTEAKVGTAGLSVTAAQLRSGESGVAVGNSPSMPALEVGDWVDVIATSPATGTEQPAAIITTGARVIAVNESSTTIAVAEEDVARVTYASTKNIATLVLTRP